LYDIVLESNVVGAVREVINLIMKKHVDSLTLNFSTEDYFNSGVFLIATKRFKEAEIKKKCFDLLTGSTKYAYLDQDALNIVCQGNVLFLDGRWNCGWHHFIYKPLQEYESTFNQISSDPWIVHFASDKKPWTMPGARFADYFWMYARKTQFYEEILYTNISMITRKELREAFKHYVLPFKKLPFGTSIVLYGAGRVGRAYHSQIITTGLYNLAKWVDKDYSDLQNLGYQVYAPEILKETAFDSVLIAVEDKEIVADIKLTLVNLGIEHHKIVWVNPKIKNSCAMNQDTANSYITEKPYDNGFFRYITMIQMGSAQKIVSKILEFIQPSSVVDVGCGNGAFCAEWLRSGVKHVLGIDGDYIDRSQLMMPKDFFLPHDLTTPLKVMRRYGLATSFEVAEHLDEKYAKQFVKTLCDLSNVVVFSAAIPEQGSTLHVNEQWQSYWCKLFSEHGYIASDYIRKAIAKDEEIAFWYRQNIVTYVCKDVVNEYPLLRKHLVKQPERLNLDLLND